jgi:Flp pilus assembly protein CpaB
MASRGRSRGLIIIVIAVVIFVLAGIVAVVVLGGGLLGSIMSSGNPAAPVAPVITPTPQGVMVDIIIVQQPVSRGTTLTESVLAKIPYPQSAMVEGLFYTDIQSVLGKRAKFDLTQGTPLVPSLLSTNTVGSIPSMQVPKGMVAISVPIDTLTSVSYALQAGDHVNVIGAIHLVDLDANFQTILPNKVAVVAPPQVMSVGADGKTVNNVTSITSKIDNSIQGRAELDATLNQPIYVQPSENQRPRLISQTVIQNAIVLGIGDLSAAVSESPAAAPTAVGGAAVTATAVPPKPKIITLIVSPQDAETLNYMILSKANITLALRNSQDDAKPTTDAVTLQYLMDSYNIPYPAKLPYGLELPVAAPTAVAPQ